MATNPNALNQPPYQSPFTDKNGMLTDPWNKWFQQLYLRIGGSLTAPIANLNDIPLTNLISGGAPLITGTLYTVPIGQRAVINSFQVTNSDVIARTISVWFVPQGLAPSTSNIVTSAVSIAAGATQILPGLQYSVINGGGTIQAMASAAGVLSVVANGRLST